MPEIPKHNKWKYAAALSVTGFTLNHLLEKNAHAYYAAGYALLTGSTTAGILTTVGIVVLIVKNTDMAALETQQEGALAQSLLESGLLNSRSDLGMELSLLVESPDAFQQMSSEVKAGNGPALAALTRTTGIAQDQLIQEWTQTAESVGQVTDEASATRFVMQFLYRMGPNLQVNQAQLADFVWQLAIEESSSPVSDGGSSHEWISNWMGIPMASVHKASREVFGPELQGDENIRAQINANPEAFLVALSRELESTHKLQIQNRIDELVAEFNQLVPEGYMEPMLQPG